MTDITAIILTYNEEKNIENCILSIKDCVSRIVVIDSFSTDKTKEICNRLAVDFYEHEFINHSKQFTYALSNTNIKTTWVLRIDADERLTPESSAEITHLCKKHQNDNINGLILRFKYYFLGKFLKHGGVYPTLKLCVFKYGFAHVEQKNMDEHIVLESGKSITCKKDCLHLDFKDLSHWINKHNMYASRELLDYLEMKRHGKIGEISNIDSQSAKKNKIKNNVYYKLPLFFRAKMYYIYRYYFCFGWLDGNPGKIYAFLQAYWYRFLVDAKLYENRIKNK